MRDVKSDESALTYVYNTPYTDLVYGAEPLQTPAHRSRGGGRRSPRTSGPFRPPRMDLSGGRMAPKPRMGLSGFASGPDAI